MKPEILFLRPFWDTSTTAEQVKLLYHVTKNIGQLVALRNDMEEAKLELLENNHYSSQRTSIWSDIFGFTHHSIDVKLIEATDEDWQEKVVQQIRSSDVILLHLAPRKAPDIEEFHELNADRIPRKHIDFSLNPTHETGTGQGLLRELDYCTHADALHKVIVLIPIAFYPRVQKVLRYLSIDHAKNTYKNTKEGLVAMIPKLSALDRSLSALRDVHSIMVYSKFGGIFFKRALRKSLESCLASQRGSVKSELNSNPLVELGLPSEPVELPPDNRLKRIRFTPIKSLTVIPRREIVELSFDEVKEMHPDITDVPYTCPGCGKAPNFIFWFQYGLEPEISKDAWIFQICQYCGHDDYIIPWNEAVRRGYVSERK